METAVDPNPQVTEAAQVLDREVSEFMTSGVVAIPDDASLLQVGRAMPAHRVHAVLVLHASAGTPLRWVTAEGLLGWVGRDRELIHARDAMTEEITAIQPTAPIGAALYALALPNVRRLLVRRRPGLLPDGVLTELDVADIDRKDAEWPTC